MTDSDAISTSSFQIPSLDLELDDEEYEIPPSNDDSASISLDDILSSADWSEDVEVAFSCDLQIETPTPSPRPPQQPQTKNDHPSTAGSLLKCVFLQGISQQIATALERIDAGVGCAVAAWGDRAAVGTSHGYVMAFTSQVLRWCCNQNKDQAAVTALDYNDDGTRLLAGFARGIVCMYESNEGSILRRIEACGGGPWGVLNVCWVPIGMGVCTTAVVADTGGSVWLLRFTRTLGIRGTKVSCLFSGARGEVCAVVPLTEGSDRWGGVLALATLSRVVVVWGVGGIGGSRPRAGCQASLVGPSDSLPLLAWQPIVMDAIDTPKRQRSPVILCSARGHIIQFHQIKWGSSGPKMSPMKSPKTLTNKVTAVRWLGARRLAILDSRETLYLWETGANAIVDYLDLSNTQLVYANAHFKGVATGGKVSEALACAGTGALGGSLTNECITGALLLLGRTGLTRITARTTLAAAHHHADMGRWVQAIETIVYRYKSLEGFSNLQCCLTQRTKSLFSRLAENPVHLTDQTVASAIIDACVQIEALDVLWGHIWDALMAARCQEIFVLVACKKASEGLLPWITPAACQQLVNQMKVDDPQLLEKALLNIPIKCMDIHQVLSECQKLKLWSAWVRVTAATAPDDPALPLRDLLPLIGEHCRDTDHSCPGDVLLLYTADCFAGRLFPMGSVSITDRPHIGQEVLRCLLYDPVEESEAVTVRLPHLRALLMHDMGSALRMLEISFSVGPFIGPLGKQKRLAMGLALHNVLDTSESEQFTDEEIAEVVSFTCNRLINGTLPADITLINHLKKHFSRECESAKANKLMETSWLNLLHSNSNVTNHLPHSEMLEMAKKRNCLKIIRFLKEKMSNFEGILETYVNDTESENEMFGYLEKHAANEERMIAKQIVSFGKTIATQWPEHTAQFLLNNFPELIPKILATLEHEAPALAFTDFIYKQEALTTDLASKHLELLCILEPKSVSMFLNDAPTTLLPDMALKLVRKHGITYAEPKCLELTGDLANALNIAIKLMIDANNKEDRDQLTEAAYALCIRAAKLSGPEEAQEFWRQLIETISSLPEPPPPPLPALLLEGASYHLPLPWLVAKLCSHGGNTGALKNALINLLETTRDNAEAMAAATRLTGTELHTALAKSLRGRKALPITSTLCGYCHHPLHSHSLTRVYWCGHAFHLDCDPVSDQCGKCGKSAVEIRSIPKKPQTAQNEPPQAFPLWIMAPPRPDLEGVI